MGRKLITLDELYTYCFTNNIANFTAKEQGDALLVSVPATFEQDEKYDSDSYLKGRFKACHTKKNLNTSYIEDDVMISALPSFANKPILASIIETKDENGDSTLDFNGHDMKIGDDKLKENEQRIEYIEKIVGVIPETNNIELIPEEGTDKSFVYVDGYVYRDYTYAADILEKRQNAEVSIEISISKFSFNAKEKYLNIEAFKFMGITLLGAEVKAGMAGSHVSIENYSLENLNPEEKDNVSTQELKEALDIFNKYILQKGGEKNLNKLQELLTKYTKTMNELVFDTEGLTDEELEAKFLEAFGEVETEPELTEPEEDPETKTGEENNDDLGEPVAEPDTSFDFTGDKKIKSLHDAQGNLQLEIEYQLSHEDIRTGLYNLLNVYNNEDGYNYLWIREVYNNYFIMEDWSDSALYKQSYSVEADNLSFSGERVKVYEMYLTETEKTALEDMRKDYSLLKSEDETRKTEMAIAQINEIFKNFDEELAEVESYSALKKDCQNYSPEDIESKVAVIFTQHELSKKKKKELGRIPFGFQETTSEKRPYGNLFDEK